MKISVLTVCLNAESYIERAIKSVLKQDYQNWEHIVVDGGSSDGTISILKKYSHLKWISEPDSGQSDAMNKAFVLCSGDIISYLNADDYYSSDAFRNVVNRFETENSDIVTGRLRILYDDKILFRDPIKSYCEVSHYWLHRFPANPVSYFYKKEVQQEVGSIPVDNHFSMDYWFLLRAFRNKVIASLDTELGVFDLHSNTKTYNSTVNDNLKDEFLAFSKELPFWERISFLLPWVNLNFKERLNRIEYAFRVRFLVLRNRLSNLVHLKQN